VIEPKYGYAQAFEPRLRRAALGLTEENPEAIVSNLKVSERLLQFRSTHDRYVLRDVRQKGLAGTISDRRMWGEMRMSPTDILDVTGATYTYLINGQPPAANWTALFRTGERVRLRFINGSSMSIFDVRIPGLSMTVIQADGNDVEPVAVDAFRISVAETLRRHRRAEGRPRLHALRPSGRSQRVRARYARASSRHDGAGPPMDPRPMRTMADMGMDHGATGHGSMRGMDHGAMNHGTCKACDEP